MGQSRCPGIVAPPLTLRRDVRGGAILPWPARNLQRPRQQGRMQRQARENMLKRRNNEDNNDNNEDNKLKHKQEQEGQEEEVVKY